MCGHCTFCTTGTGVEFSATPSIVADPKKIKEILNACEVRDDPRLLARFAFGISSPRLAVLKCSTQHLLFGSMVSVDFNALVQAFDKECKTVDYTNVIVATTSTTNTKKRGYTETTTKSVYTKKTNNYSSKSYQNSSSSSSSSYRGRGRGGGSSGYYKRARY